MDFKVAHEYLGGIEQYDNMLADIRQHALDDMENAKRRDGLDDVEIDISKLKPKW